MLVPLRQEQTTDPDATARGAAPGALRVGVLVDLPWTPQSGGHVKCWERLAGVASALAGILDLTIHFMGPDPLEIRIADNVRYRIDPPIFSTARLGFLSHVPDHTDLAPWHPGLAAALAGYDVLHSTGAYFSFARTALRVARRTGIPLVSSVHTNTPEYARIFTAQTIERALASGALSGALNRTLDLPGLVERRMLRELARYQQACRFVFVSRPAQLASAAANAPNRVGLLRRGIDRHLFSPEKRDRAWLRSEFGIPGDKTVALYVGRINRGKNVGVLASAVAALVERGTPVHLICAGEGEEHGAIQERLGPDASCPGNVDTERLARLYASADIFAFPSEVEEYANVVLEALASGLPVVLAGRSEMGRTVVPEVTGLVLSGDQPSAWADAIAALVTDPQRRRRMSRAARSYAELRLPSWHDVLTTDLLPRWQKVARWQPLEAASA